MIDEGMALRHRLSGAGVKPLQAAAFKRCGGERWSKAPRVYLGQVQIRKTSKPEPLLTRRNPVNGVKTRGVSIPWDKSTGNLITV